MRTLSSIVLVLLMTGTARAQARGATLPEQRAAGGSVGISMNGDRNSGHAGLSVAGMFEVPMRPAWRLRVDVGRAAWIFDKREAAPLVPARDKVSLTRATVGVVKSLSPPPERYPLGIYAGGAVGIYHYGFAEGDAPHPTRAGVSGIGGAEYFLRRSRAAIVGEVQMHAVRGPNSSGADRNNQVFSEILFTLSASIGVKWRF